MKAPTPYSDAIGDRRITKGGVVWEVVGQMPHKNGDPAHLRVRSESGREKTIYAVDWSTWDPVGRRQPSDSNKSPNPAPGGDTSGVENER